MFFFRVRQNFKSFHRNSWLRQISNDKFISCFILITGYHFQIGQFWCPSSTFPGLFINIKWFNWHRLGFIISTSFDTNLILMWTHFEFVKSIRATERNNYTTMAFTASLKRLLIGLLLVMALFIMILYLNESQSILKPASSFFISNYEAKHSKIKLVAVVAGKIRM